MGVCVQVHNVQQSVIDTKNRAKDKAWRFWQTAFPKNPYDDLLSQGKIPSNTAAVGHKPQGSFQPALNPAYSWRGQTWSDETGHLQRGGLPTPHALIISLLHPLAHSCPTPPLHHAVIHPRMHPDMH